VRLDPLAEHDLFAIHDHYHRLRAASPVVHSPEFGGFWAVLAHREVRQVLSDPALFINSVQNVVPKVRAAGRRPPLHLDPPEHTVYRRALAPTFRSERTAALEPPLRALVGEWADVAGEFAEYPRLDPYTVEQAIELVRRRLWAFGFQLADDAVQMLAAAFEAAPPRGGAWEAHRLAERLAASARTRTVAASDLPRPQAPDAPAAPAPAPQTPAPAPAPAVNAVPAAPPPPANGAAPAEGRPGPVEPPQQLRSLVQT